MYYVNLWLKDTLDLQAGYKSEQTAKNMVMLNELAYKKFIDVGWVKVEMVTERMESTKYVEYDENGVRTVLIDNSKSK